MKIPELILLLQLKALDSHSANILAEQLDGYSPASAIP